MEEVKALLFDVFGTVVDWRSGVIDQLSSLGSERGIRADWPLIADEWRDLYQPSLEEVRSGRRPWTVLDPLHRESLVTLLQRHEIAGFDEADIDRLTVSWHRLPPWPDSVEGIVRLKRRYIVSTLSNGHTALLVNMAKHAGLPWDVILGAETARAYKPLPEAYLRNIEMLGLAPGQCMMVAAHQDDLKAASAVGMRTAYVMRPKEFGPGRVRDLTPVEDWDQCNDSIVRLAEAMGC